MRKLFFVILSLFSLANLFAQKDSLTVSLITCWPGEEVYELCGHEAIRIRGSVNGHPLDSVWNYGTFDFEQPNFIYRFVKGETDYMLSSYPFAWFLPEYRQSGRRVVEQDLNLSPEESEKLLARLRVQASPEHRTYRYNYVKDNCATRILGDLDIISSSRIFYPDSVHYGTFRNEMRAYHKDYPWYQFGIDLALGSGLDYPLDGREEMFVPVEMMRKVANAHFADGRPLVSATRVLNEGVPAATAGPTPWFLTPLVLSLAWFVIAVILCACQWKRKTIWKIVYSVWFAVLGITGCVVAFLIFVSSHEATSPNILLLWLNPLQLVVAIGVWFRRRWHAATVAMIYVNIILLTVLMIIWPLQSQSANPAFFPLMAATLALAVTYAILQSKISFIYNNEEIDGHHAHGGGAKRAGTRSRSAGRRPSASRGRNRR